MLIRSCLAACCLALSLAVQAETPLLFDGSKKTMYPAAQLLNHPALRHIEVPVDVAYKRPMSYDAVPLVWLLKAHGVLPSDTIQFKALDGFAMSLPAAPLFAGWIDAPDVLTALRDAVPLAANARPRVMWPAGEGEMPGARQIDLCDERNWTSGVHGGWRPVCEGNLKLEERT